jgi:hypothetical protein
MVFWRLPCRFSCSIGIAAAAATTRFTMDSDLPADRGETVSRVCVCAESLYFRFHDILLTLELHL